jgi:hypothetical protein
MAEYRKGTSRVKEKDGVERAGFPGSKIVSLGAPFYSVSE